MNRTNKFLLSAVPLLIFSLSGCGAQQTKQPNYSFGTSYYNRSSSDFFCYRSLEGDYGTTAILDYESMKNVPLCNKPNCTHNKNDCVIYDADRKKLILYTTTGKRIEIKPTDYLDLKVNFFTSNVLKFTYRVGERKYKKVTLGYCSNREELRNNLRKVIVDYEHNKIRN